MMKIALVKEGKVDNVAEFRAFEEALAMAEALEATPVDVTNIAAWIGDTYRKMTEEVENFSAQIKLLEEQERVDRQMKAVDRAPLLLAPTTPSIQTGRASSEYGQNFWNAMRGQDFVRNALKIGSDPDGGHLVPDEFEHTLVEALEEQNVLRQLATVIRTDSGERQIPVVATKGTASWVEEEALIPESGDTFGQVTLNAYKLTTMLKVSNELLNDSVFPIESYIAKEFARRIGNKEEEAFFTGDGSKKPTGIFAGTGGAPVSITTASATVITMDEVMDLYYALKAPYRAKAVFVTNDNTVKVLRKLKDANEQYLWQPSVQQGTPDILLGRPVYLSSYVPAIAAGAKALAFGDFSYYWIADRQSRTFQRLNELYAPNGQVGYIATQRVDGKLILPEAVQVLRMGS